MYVPCVVKDPVSVATYKNTNVHTLRNSLMGVLWVRKNLVLNSNYLDMNTHTRVKTKKP